ncbi:Crp/Fnr family transcriptional regulator [Paenibacillus sp. NAIST15-1]|uniref:Crp/Fnr family transcriptional regulator n=1 Tax=Paenibacillus sp. NAIST15-1 TaxID=1605994 RepID=UPI00086E492B|nr:Crp/Fnr family transcriptional regulator [Paenibacillus sp. NAIST15-1]GAV16034.1 Crp/Fnr family transcriptional regulator [Paenibacillus sp. NAIST15-1]
MMITDIRSISIFEELSDEAVERIMPMLSKRQFRKNQVIIYESDHNGDVFLIRSGSIKIYSLFEDKEIIYGVAFPGHVVGEIEAIHYDDYRIASIAAMETVHTWYLKKQDFQTILDEYPSVLRRCYWLLVESIRILNRKAQYISFLDTRLKTANLIYDLYCNLGRKAEGESAYIIGYKLTHHVIANMLGVTRESVSKVLKDFQEEGIISIEQKTIKIVDLPTLRSICDRVCAHSPDQRRWYTKAGDNSIIDGA